MGAYCELTGLDDVIAELSKLADLNPDPALKKAGKVFEEKMKQFAPTASNDLRNAIRCNPPKDDELGNRSVEISTKTNGGKSRNGVFYGHMVDKGHAVVTPGGKKKGKTAGTNFVERAYAAGKNEAMEIIETEITKGMGI